MREGVSGPDCERVDMYTAAQKQKILSELGNLPELPSRETRIRLAYTRRIYPEPLCDMRYVEAMGLAELAHEMHKNSREIVPPERLA